ncbi:hypothetical protein BST61_g7887 [Cercospora zeina]
MQLLVAITSIALLFEQAYAGPEAHSPYGYGKTPSCPADKCFSSVRLNKHVAKIASSFCTKYINDSTSYHNHGPSLCHDDFYSNGDLHDFSELQRCGCGKPLTSKISSACSCFLGPTKTITSTKTSTVSQTTTVTMPNHAPPETTIATETVTLPNDRSQPIAINQRP